MKDYSKLDEVIVKIQEELDEIPADYQGRIYIEGGKPWARIYVSKRYPNSVVARGNSSVVARENSSVVARENSSVVARGNSSVVAWENSSVVARENSSVEAWGNVQVVDYLQGARIKISGNARIVTMPKTIFEFMDFYEVKHTKTTATFYKAVHKNHDGTLYSDRDNDFVYVVGEIKKEECDPRTDRDCSYGLHVSTLNWALNFGNDWEDFTIIEVQTRISDIVMPKGTDGKVRTSRLKVLREVPLEECGLYGKILAKRRNGMQ